MKNTFIGFVIGLSTLSFCSATFAEETPQTLEKNVDLENVSSNQDTQPVEENLTENTVKNIKEKKKSAKKTRKKKNKTDKKRTPKKSRRHNKKASEQEKNISIIKEEETHLKSIPQEEKIDIHPENTSNSSEENE